MKLNIINSIRNISWEYPSCNIEIQIIIFIEKFDLENLKIMIRTSLYIVLNLHIMHNCIICLFDSQVWFNKSKVKEET